MLNEENYDAIAFAVLRALPVPVLLKDAESRFVFVNEEAARFFGVPPAAIAGRRDEDFFPADQATVYRTIDKDVLLTGKPNENEESITAANGVTHRIVTRKALLHIDRQPYVMATFHDVTQLRSSEERIRYLAYHDLLTGLPNRAALYDRLGQLLGRGQLAGEASSLLLIDLDGFKKVNDTYGHQAGDELLQEYGRRLKAAVTDEDLVVRMGGDEFAVLVCAKRWSGRLDGLCEQVIGLASEPFRVVGVQSFVRASVGAVKIGAHDASAGEIIRKADTALYESKHKGKGRFFIYTPAFDASIFLRRTIEIELARSLVDGVGLSCAYQPLICTADGRITGVEALARWEHPKLGSLPPVQFVPVAEETGLISRLGEWVLRRACQEARSWDIDLLAVNISPLQLRDAGFADRVLTILEQEEFQTSRLELEITETAVMNADEASLGQLRTLRGAGVSVALDDFGTGYSSLRLLQDLELDKVKIDQSFVQFATDAGGSAAIIEGLARLGTNLGIQVVAEGVEREDQRALLVDIGCTGMQGFLFSKPIDASLMDELILGWPNSRTSPGLGN